MQNQIKPKKFRGKILEIAKALLFWSAFAVLLVVLSFLILPNYLATDYEWQPAAAVAGAPDFSAPVHIPTPVPLKAVYMTGWVGGNKEFRTSIEKMIERTELNAVVIDIKDYSGRISFRTDSALLNKYGAPQDRIPDIKDFIAELHKNGVYVIGRISAFQDPKLVAGRPDLAVKKKSDKSAVWTDYKGISWLDASARDAWDYLVELGKVSYALGFDELNFDYIRFPSDGNMSDIYYPWSDGKTKTEAMKDFFAYLSEKLKPMGVVLSADLFGMTTTNSDDLNIGQVLENTLPYFDYVAPMVYPSHYPPTFMGFANPADKPYEVVKYSMDKAFERASTTPWKIRPWLQDFNLGAKYTPEMVKLEIKAVYDAGFDSWMLWNAANVYTEGALLPKGSAQ